MSSYSRVFIVISVLYILTFVSPVFSQNCVPVGEKFNLTFSYPTPQTAVFWKKNNLAHFTAVVNSSSGSGCQGGGNTLPGFTFYCEDGGATYIMEITSKLSDKDANFTANPTVGSLVYTPITDVNQCPNSLLDCNQPGEKVENKFTLSCESTCTLDHHLILQYQPESGPVQDLENNVNPTMVKCNNYADLYKSTFNYIVDSNHAVLGQFNSTTNKVRLIVNMDFGGRNETVFQTIYFYVVPPDSVTTLEPTTTQTSSSRMSSETPTSSLSSPSSSLSSSPSDQDGGGSPSTETSSDLPSSPTDTKPTATTPTPTPSTVTTPKPTDTKPTDTSPTPSPLTTTELIIVVVCSCVAFLLLGVLVVCCVILSTRRKNRKRRPPRNKPYSDNSMTRYPYHHSLKTETQKTTSSSNPGSRQPSSSERVRPGLQYTNYGYYDRPDDRHTYRNYDNNLRQYRNYDNRPSRRDDNRHHREDINLTPYRLYYQPHQYHYL